MINDGQKGNNERGEEGKGRVRAINGGKKCGSERGGIRGEVYVVNGTTQA